MSSTLEELVQAILAPNRSVGTSNLSVGLGLEQHIARVENKSCVAISTDQSMSVQSQSVVLPNKQYLVLLLRIQMRDVRGTYLASL